MRVSIISYSSGYVGREIVLDSPSDFINIIVKPRVGRRIYCLSRRNPCLDSQFARSAVSTRRMRSAICCPWIAREIYGVCLLVILRQETWSFSVHRLLADSEHMKAICVGADRTLLTRDIPMPEKPVRDHIIVRMDACAINPGDKFFLGRTPPPDLALSLYDAWGVSGAGTVVAAGEGVPSSYVGKKVAVYRSLQKTENLIGTWCEYSQLHRLNCVLLSAELDTRDYAGSLVNVITPYAFWKTGCQRRSQRCLDHGGRFGDWNCDAGDCPGESDARPVPGAGRRR